MLASVRRGLRLLTSRVPCIGGELPVGGRIGIVAAPRCQQRCISGHARRHAPATSDINGSVDDATPVAAGPAIVTPASVRPAIQLWPQPADATPILTTAQLITRFIDSVQGAPTRPPSHYTRGGVLLVDDGSLSDDLSTAVDSLSSLLGLRVFRHTDARQLHEAVNTDKNGATTRMGDMSDSDRPQFLVVVDSSRICATVVRVEGRREEARLVSGGTCCVLLDDASEYKRRGAHGYDTASPLVRACFGEEAASRLRFVTGNENRLADDQLHVLDVTMGPGADSFLLASFGARVSMVEQDAVLALMMMDGLRRATQLPTDKQHTREVAAIASRMTLNYGDAINHVQSLHHAPSDRMPDVIYADPFYPDPPPSALAEFSGGTRSTGKSLSKKSMELARNLWSNTQERVDGDSFSPSFDSSPPLFHPSRANFALHALLYATLTSPAANRVILKQPGTAYARRLVSHQMPFEFVENFVARDTVFYRVELKNEKQIDKSRRKLERQQQGRTDTRHKGSSSSGNNGNKKQPKGKNGRRSFATAAFRSQDEPLTSRADPADPSIHGAAAAAATTTPSSYSFSPIGFVRSVLRDKFAIPRQSSLAASATAVLTLDPAVDGHAAALPNRSWTRTVDGLADFSHAWIVFVFHQHEKNPSTDDSSVGAPTDADWRPLVRPPRLGGAQRVGVFASRSPYRPCSIGMSAVKLDRVVTDDATGRVHIHFSGVDLLDGTPVLDVKPYVPYCDAKTGDDMRLGWAQQSVERFDVTWNDEVRQKVEAIQSGLDLDSHRDPASPRVLLGALITDLLSLDPRHGYQQLAHPVRNNASKGRRYGFQVLDWDVSYSMDGTGFIVESIQTMEEFHRQNERRRQQGRQEDR